MNCAWKEIISVIPFWMRNDVDHLGSMDLQELRLRINAPPELRLNGKSLWLNRNVTTDDLNYCVNAASRYSPWAVQTCRQGYITIAGGHRIGISGEVVQKNDITSGFRGINALCIRVARDYIGIGRAAEEGWGSFLIISPPGWGKTTLLRDCVRTLAERNTVSVIDERGELFPCGFKRGKMMDVLTGCTKEHGISLMMRTMNPDYIAVDEITEGHDCDALLHAIGCGVKLAATAHAGSMTDFESRPVYQSLLKNKVFNTVLVLHKDKSFTMERLK